MTNNPTIDGVSRELLLNKCSCGSTDISFCYESPQGHWILCYECGETSPSFENKGSALDHWNKRAPAVERQENKCGQCSASSSDVCNQNGCGFLESGNGEPEVAALQSTIAQLQARIGELESGRGEPAAWVHPNYLKQPKNGFQLAIDVTLTQMAPAQVPLFTAPPLPVAVVLPERKTFEPPSYRDQFAEGWNSCLYATAALNGPAK